MLLAGDKPKNSEYTFQLTSIFRPPPSNLGRRRTFVALWWARAKENESPSTFGALRRDSWRTMKIPAVCLLFFFFFFGATATSQQANVFLPRSSFMGLHKCTHPCISGDVNRPNTFKHSTQYCLLPCPRPHLCNHLCTKTTKSISVIWSL